MFPDNTDFSRTALKECGRRGGKDGLGGVISACGHTFLSFYCFFSVRGKLGGGGLKFLQRKNI